MAAELIPGIRDIEGRHCIFSASTIRYYAASESGKEFEINPEQFETLNRNEVAVGLLNADRLLSSAYNYAVGIGIAPETVTAAFETSPPQVILDYMSGDITVDFNGFTLAKIKANTNYFRVSTLLHTSSYDAYQEAYRRHPDFSMYSPGMKDVKTRLVRVEAALVECKCGSTYPYICKCFDGGKYVKYSGLPNGVHACWQTSTYPYDPARLVIPLYCSGSLPSPNRIKPFHPDHVSLVPAFSSRESCTNIHLLQSILQRLSLYPIRTTPPCVSAPSLSKEDTGGGPAAASCDDKLVERAADAPPPTHRVGGESTNCSICLDGPSNFACVPCGHRVLCGECSVNLRGLTDVERQTCPMCRARFTSIIRIYV